MSEPMTAEDRLASLIQKVQADHTRVDRFPKFATWGSTASKGEGLQVATQPKQKPGQSKQDYATPPVFIEAVKRLLRIERFAFDFAADETNAKARLWWGEEQDSLSMSADTWASQLDGEWGWLNPPFAQIGPWAKRCSEVARKTDGKIAFLVPAAVGANWFRDYVWNKHTHTLFLNGRIPFMPDKPKWLYPKDCILVLYAFGYQGSRIWTWRNEQPQSVGAVDPHADSTGKPSTREKESLASRPQPEKEPKD